MQRRTTIFLALMALCAVMAGVQTASAQNVTTGTLVGVVMDTQKAVLPGATVIAVHGPTGTIYEAVTQADGRFTFLAVRVGGPYKVTATMSGFKPQDQDGIQVALGESHQVEFVLALQTVQESVTVVAVAQNIDTTRAGTGSNIATQTIEALPSISRSINDFARTSPFVNISQAASGNDQEVSVAGRPNRYNNMLIDGAVNNDVFGLSSTGTPGGQTGTQPVSLDVIQEIQVLVSPYDVRQGGFSGGGINAITKSGSNALHGTGYYFGRNQKFMGTIPGVPTNGNASPADSIVGAFSDKQFGASLGGPIAKNKAFFFGNVDWARKLTPVGYSLDGSSGSLWNNNLADVQSVLSTLQSVYKYNPGGVGEVSRPNNSDKIFLRTDFNLSPSNQLVARVNYVNAAASIGSSSASGYNMPDHYYYMTDKMLSSVGQLNTTFGSSMFNELRVTYQRERNIRGGQPGNPAFPEVQIYMPGSTSNYIYVGTEYSSHANKLNQDIIEFTDDLTLVTGNHTLSIGTHNEFYKFYNLFIQNAYGAYRFSSIANFQAGFAQSFAHYYSNTSNPDEAAQFSVQQFGFYAGDKWRPASNLTITYGARVDLPRFPDKPLANPIPVADFGYATDVVPSPAMWSPRAGFNWDLSGGGARRSQIRGGFGLFSGRTPYVWLSNQYGNTGVQFTNLSTSYTTTNQIPFIADPANQPTTVTGGTSGRQTINVIDPNYSYPSIVRANIAVDRDLGFLGLVGTAELLYSKTVKDIYYQNLNMKATGVQPDGRLQYNGTGTVPVGTAWSFGQQTLRPDPNLNNVLLLTNSNQGNSWSMAFKVERPFKKGFHASASYLYGRAYSTVDGTSSVANSNFTGTPIGVDANHPALSLSNYSPGSRLNLSATVPVPLWGGVRSSLSFFYNGQQGRPYDLRYNQDANGDSATGNDLLFIPANASQVLFTGGTIDNLNAWLQKFPGATDYTGKIIARNALRAPWSNSVDLRYAVTISTPGRTKVELTADVLNFLNLLNKKWGWQWWGPFPSSGQAIGYSIDQATGLLKYNVTTLTAASSNQYGNVLSRDDLRSRWQAQFGVRFRF
ncbi:MAG: carboxypeptidase regulatory-like domain-containing protein [Acidobacteriota bacterium]